MRIVFLGNNWVAWKIAEWLREQNEEVVAAVVHPPEKEKYREEILSSLGLEDSRVFDASQLRDGQVVVSLRNLSPQIGISAYFGYIMRPDFLELLPAGCINVHPAFLPYNRGAYPNVWSIVEGTPAGVTIHYVDDGIDTGDIIAQREISVEPVDTGETLYHRLERAALELFRETWPKVRSGEVTRVAQDPELGTLHRVRDVEQIDEIDLEASYRARELIDILRARTFPPNPGAYVREGDRKVYLRLSLMYEDELMKEGERGAPNRD